MTQQVIKGRKYILAGNFLPEYKEQIISNLEKELEIEIVAVITSDNTLFIEYVEDNQNEVVITQEEYEKHKSNSEELNELKKRFWYKFFS